MISFELAAIFRDLQLPESRLSGTQSLAAYAGAESSLVFGRDQEVGVFLPALGLPQTMRHGIKWKSFLNQCAQSGIHADMLPRADGSETASLGLADESKNAIIVFLGSKEIDQQVQQSILALLPLLGAKLLSERSALASEARANAARHASQVAGELNAALDANRRELQKAWQSAEEEIQSRREAEAKLRDADRRKDEFLAMLAHELRNPLAPISSAASLLALLNANEPRALQTSKVISRQVAHMTRLIDELLDVSRVTRGLIMLDHKIEDFRRIVSGALDQTRPLIEQKRHHVCVQMPDEPVYVRGDETRLVQAVANILNNAAKYTPEPGKIDIKLEAGQEQLWLRIKDNGTGISPELLPSVFELFTQGARTLARSQGGLGLGLALVQKLVQLHGGSVTAQSAGNNLGSEFVITLPIALLPANAPQECNPLHGLTDMKQAEGHSVRLHLIVIDDNFDAADGLASLLRAQGHTVTVFYTPEEALGQATIDVPHAFLIDIGLPNIDGYELAQRLHALPQLAQAVLIAVSGYGQIQDRERSKAAGFTYHLVKPIDMVALTTILDNVLQVTGHCQSTTGASCTIADRWSNLANIRDTTHPGR
jgi:signal transduction histidine kinase/FixJ family two-component response regulator